MTTPLRILVVGAGSPNADMVAEVLNANGFRAQWTDKIRFPSPFLLHEFDLVYGIYLQTCSRYIIAAKFFGKKTIIHFVGSDAYWFARERVIMETDLLETESLHLTDLVFYVSPHLQELRSTTRIRASISNSDRMSIKSPEIRKILPDRDILYYCPGGERNAEIYRLQWITEYARQHPDEKITIIGNITHPANYEVNLPNVEVVPFVERAQMPDFLQTTSEANSDDN